MSREVREVLVTCDRCGLERVIYVWALGMSLDAWLSHKGWQSYPGAGQRIDICHDCLTEGP